MTELLNASSPQRSAAEEQLRGKRSGVRGLVVQHSQTVLDLSGKLD
ncbi:hypothetical protein [Bradyrhizobium sp.]|nr:hypothetical protein [Bradyrhizobium sp.]MBV8917088.1 hypothetical protein [Bradyrhizobium sp.]MBV9984226.1 hypothetical protein [Bradyrhizobium sp.]